MGPKYIGVATLTFQDNVQRTWSLSNAIVIVLLMHTQSVCVLV